jgi:hypothetical protein
MRMGRIQFHSLSPKSTPFLLSPWKSAQFAGAGRAGSGAAPHAVKDASGATRGPLRGSLTGGTLRPLTPAHVGRPVACPLPRTPRTRTLSARTDGWNRAVGVQKSGRGFTRTDALRAAPAWPCPARTAPDHPLRTGGDTGWWSP